jgi:pimeloyl-ACP methyl ester carboxylesterase
MMINQWRDAGDFFLYRKHDVDYRIFYRDSAQGILQETSKPALLLIHGFPTASIDWQHIWSSLSEHFRLVTLDMIGFGLSDKPSNYAYSIHDQADVFQNLLNNLDITNYHILAHDYGDTVAQELLARQIDREVQESVPLAMTGKIRSTILLNGGLFPETHRPVLMQKLLISPLGPWLIKLYSYEKFKKTFAFICAKPIVDEELKTYWQLLQHNNGTKVMPKLIRYMKERKQYRQRWVGALESINIPLRVIDGIADPISGLHMVERYRQLIKKPDVIELKDIGHYPQVEAPQEVLTAALEFWKMHHIITTPN